MREKSVIILLYGITIALVVVQSTLYSLVLRPLWRMAAGPHLIRHESLNVSGPLLVGIVAGCLVIAVAMLLITHIPGMFSQDSEVYKDARLRSASLINVALALGQVVIVVFLIR